MKRRILLLCDLVQNNASTVVEHIRSYNTFSQHEYVICSGRGDLLVGVDLGKYDGLIIHYSLVACIDSYVAPVMRRKIRTFPGYKAAFVQDDYRFIDATCAALDYMRIHALFALPGEDIIERVYTQEKLPGVRKITTLAGYVPDSLIGIETPPYESRLVDVSYRARKVPQWLGEHSLQKWEIADKFRADASHYDLVVDISHNERDRIYGHNWTKFISNSKAVLGTESGASVSDFTGEIQKNVEEHLKRDNKASFEELSDLYFKDNDGEIIINVISPRCFEAAALRTLMIMYEGNYSGVMKSWKHFVPLKKDHSNMAEVVAILRDPARAAVVIKSAYDDLVLSGSYSYRAMMQQVDSVMEESFAAGITPSPLLLSTQHCNKKYYMLERLRSLSSFVRRSMTSRIYCLKVSLSPYLQRYQSVYRCYKQMQSYWNSFVTSRMFKASDAQIFNQLIKFFRYANDAELHLHLSVEAKQLQLVSYPIGDGPVRVNVLPHDELRCRLLAGEIDTIVWVNKNLLGLGSNAPFFEKYSFEGLSLKLRRNPKYVTNVFFGKKYNVYTVISIEHTQ